MRDQDIRWKQLAGVALVLGAQCVAAPARSSDGVIEINQARALAGSVTPGDTPGFPIEIYTPGSYRLTSDLSVPGNAEAGLFVYAAGTRIDLGGFRIQSVTQCPGVPPVCAPTGTGIGIDSSGANDIQVRNGRIAGFGVYGLFLAEGSRAENLTVEGNGMGGIITAEAAVVVVDDIVRNNGGVGVSVGAASRVASNVIHNNGGQGLVAPESALSDRNAINGNVGQATAGSRNRRFYLTKTGFLGSATTTACASGFHMASLWEIFDPSALTYDHVLGFTGSGNATDDVGRGPVAGFNGWVRTGFSQIITPTTAGQVSCTGWTNGTISQNGTAARLRTDWTNPGAAWPWDVTALQCNFPNSVWCVED